MLWTEATMEASSWLTEQAMKIIERIVDGLVRQVVSIDDSEFGCVPERGTTDWTFEAGEIPGSEQEALYGLSAPRESIWLCPT